MPHRSATLACLRLGLLVLGLSLGASISAAKMGRTSTQSVSQALYYC